MAHKCLTSPQTSFPQQNTNQTELFLTRILRIAYIKTIMCTRTSKSTDSSIPLPNDPSPILAHHAKLTSSCLLFLLQLYYFLKILLTDPSCIYFCWLLAQRKKKLSSKLSSCLSKKNSPPKKVPRKTPELHPFQIATPILPNSSRCLLGFPL